MESIKISAESLATFQHDKNVLPSPPEMIVMDAQLENVIEVWDGYKDVTELRRDELEELKQAYLFELENEGTLAEVTGCDRIYWSDLAFCDSIVPDDVIFEHYAGTQFGCEDFCCNMH